MDVTYQGVMNYLKRTRGGDRVIKVPGGVNKWTKLGWKPGQEVTIEATAGKLYFLVQPEEAFAELFEKAARSVAGSAQTQKRIVALEKDIARRRATATTKTAKNKLAQRQKELEALQAPTFTSKNFPKSAAMINRYAKEVLKTGNLIESFQIIAESIRNKIRLF
jgi:hypothetical protein